MAEQHATGLGQRDGAWAARPVDQPLADERSSIAICWLIADCV